MLNYEQRYFVQGINFIAGTDEAGRGPLAGPVVAAAVIFPPDFRQEEINDSKQLSDKKRRYLATIIREHALAIGIGIVDAPRIDVINIYRAAREAMEIALKQLNHRYDMVISDAMPLPDEIVPVVSLVHGDALALCIAAASIIAKVTRDDIMIELDQRFPGYGFARNKGYGTKEHLEALRRLGPIRGIHRTSFAPVAEYNYEQITLF